MKHQVILTESKSAAVKCQSPSLIVQEACLIELKPQVSHSSTTPSNTHDETFSNISSLIASLPNKVYENCQRTARVIMLSELEKQIGKNKKLKLELSKNLQSFLPQNNEDMEEQGQYTTKTNYFKSLHYSRVRIGQRYFINKILHNPVFQQKFQIIFGQQTYQSCEKARKNQNSRVSFQKRKKVITSIINQFKKSFQDFFNDYQEKRKEISKEISIPIEESINNGKIEQCIQPTNYLIQEETDTRMCYFLMPIIPIPLTPLEYRFYQQTRNMYQ